MRREMTLLVGLVLAATLLCPRGLLADVIHLKNGSSIEVTAWRDTGDAIEYIRFGGTVRISKEDVLRIDRAAPRTDLPPASPPPVATPPPPAFPPAVAPPAKVAAPPPTSGPPALPGREPAEPSLDAAVRIAVEGRSLSPEQVAELEKKLRRDPKDLATRLRLIGYYWRGGGEAGPSGEPYGSLVLGLIREHPRSTLAGEGYGLSRQNFDKGARLWLDLAKANPADPKILGNAGTFLTRDLLIPTYWAQGEALLEKAYALEPKNPRWAEKLAMAAEPGTLGLGVPADAQRKAAAKRLRYLEEAYRLTDEGLRGSLRLQEQHAFHPLATAAMAAGETAKAKRYATDVLKAVTKEEEGLNYGNVIHDANLILGRIALREGKVGEATRYLLAAGQTPGSPQLNSFGPDMSLAEELLAKGERQAVIDYLDLCAKFWKFSEGRLKQWKDAIRAGQRPDFGGQSRP